MQMNKSEKQKKENIKPAPSIKKIKVPRLEIVENITDFNRFRQKESSNYGNGCKINITTQKD